MKIKSVLSAVSFGIALTGSANAAEFYSPAYINQIGSGTYKGSFATMSTEDIVKPMFQVATGLSSLRPSQGNLALIWQEGDTNTASITQDGTGNVGLIRQIGLENTASVTQSGSGHQALVFQQGRGNVAIIHQR
jgi:minor curlin subunit